MPFKFTNTIKSHKTFNFLPVLGITKHPLTGAENVTGNYKNYKFDSYWEFYFGWTFFCLSLSTQTLNKNSQ